MTATAIAANIAPLAGQNTIMWAATPPVPADPLALPPFDSVGATADLQALVAKAQASGIAPLVTALQAAEAVVP